MESLALNKAHHGVPNMSTNISSKNNKLTIEPHIVQLPYLSTNLRTLFNFKRSNATDLFWSSHNLWFLTKSRQGHVYLQNVQFKIRLIESPPDKWYVLCKFMIHPTFHSHHHYYYSQPVVYSPYEAVFSSSKWNSRIKTKKI